MTNFTIGISIAVLIIVFVACMALLRPVSDDVRLGLKLTIVNALGWVIILPLSEDGHPPLWLILGGPFWLLNLVLVPAALVALWKSYKERDENTKFLLMGGVYFVLNCLVLFVLPVVWLFR